MLQQIHQKLTGVVRRKRMVQAAQGMVWGCLAGTLLGVLLFIFKWLNYPVGVSSIAYGLLGSVIIGGLCALAWPVRMVGIARKVDASYQLKDRIETALLFASRPEPTALEQMQMQDAYSRMDQIKPQHVYPWTRPKHSGLTLACVALLFGCFFVPYPVIEEASRQVDDLMVVKQQADQLEDSMLKELEELVQEHPEPELKELYEKLKEDVQELQEPEANQETALLKLSEMQQEIAAAMEKFNLEKMDADLRELGQALQAAKSLEGAASAMQQGEHEKAAQELEEWDASNLSRKERTAVAANLSKMLDDGQSLSGELSDAAEALKEGLESDNPSQCKNGQRKVCQACKSQSLKKKLSQCLACQLDKLSECKGQCQGNCNKPSNRVIKTNKPSNKIGSGASGNPLGEQATSLEGTRNQENLQGIAGEGPVEREVTESPKGNRTQREVMKSGTPSTNGKWKRCCKPNRCHLAIVKPCDVTLSPFVRQRMKRL